jgi:F-type H+-transporting ATPase subunit gamma
MDDLFRVPSGQPAGPARREDGIRHVADSVMALFLGGQAKDVRVLFSKFVSGLVQRPTIVQALPVPPPALGPAARPGDAAAWARAASFSPGRGEVLAGILPQYVESVLRDAAAQSMASENAARQAAMTRATDNARDMLADLMTQYYRLRQESITRELLEIARGAEAA